MVETHGLVDADMKCTISNISSNHMLQCRVVCSERSRLFLNQYINYN